MLRLAALALVVGSLAAAAFLVPWNGRTVADRWRASPSAGAFAAGAWAELRGAPPPGERPRQRSRGAAPRERDAAPRERDAAQRERAAAPSRRAPAEEHTASERAALDRLLSDRSR